MNKNDPYKIPVSKLEFEIITPVISMKALLFFFVALIVASILIEIKESNDIKKSTEYFVNYIFSAIILLCLGFLSGVFGIFYKFIFKASYKHSVIKMFNLLLVMSNFIITLFILGFTGLIVTGENTFIGLLGLE